MKDFNDFQKYFKEYQKRFGLTGYKVYFKYEPVENAFAQIQVNSEDMVATVFLNKDLPEKDKPFKDVKRSAKHEAIHLLTNKLEDLARWRYVRADEISQSSEELAFKLEDLIQD